MSNKKHMSFKQVRLCEVMRELDEVAMEDARNALIAKGWHPMSKDALDFFSDDNMSDSDITRAINNIPRYNDDRDTVRLINGHAVPFCTK